MRKILDVKDFVELCTASFLQATIITLYEMLYLFHYKIWFINFTIHVQVIIYHYNDIIK